MRHTKCRGLFCPELKSISYTEFSSCTIEIIHLSLSSLFVVFAICIFGCIKFLKTTSVIALCVLNGLALIFGLFGIVYSSLRLKHKIQWKRTRPIYGFTRGDHFQEDTENASPAIFDRDGPTSEDEDSFNGTYFKTEVANLISTPAEPGEDEANISRSDSSLTILAKQLEYNIKRETVNPANSANIRDRMKDERDKIMSPLLSSPIVEIDEPISGTGVNWKLFKKPKRHRLTKNIHHSIARDGPLFPIYIYFTYIFVVADIIILLIPKKGVQRGAS